MGDSISFSLGYDTGPMVTGAARAQVIANRTMAKIGAGSAAAMGMAAGATVAAFEKVREVVEKVSEKVGGIWELGDALQKLSEKTNVTTGRLYMMQRGFRVADIETEKLTPAMRRMQVLLGAAAAGSKTATASIEDLGLTVADLQKLKPDEQFVTIAKAIGGIVDPAWRATVAAGVFGQRLGGELMPLFRDTEAIDMMGAKLDAQAKVFQRSAASFDEANKKLNRLKKQFSAFWVGLAGATIEPILKSLKRLQGVNFVEKGAELGKALVPIINAVGWIASKLPAAGYAFSAGMMGAAAIGFALGEQLFEVVERVGNGINAALAYASAAALDLVAKFLQIPSGLAEIGGALEWAFRKAMEFFNNGILDIIANIGAALQLAIQTAIAKAISILPEKMKKFLGMENFKPMSFEELQKDAKQKVADKKIAPVDDLSAFMKRWREKSESMMPGVERARQPVLNARNIAQDVSNKSWQDAVQGMQQPSVQPIVEALMVVGRDFAGKAKAAWNAPAAAEEKKSEAKKKNWWEMPGLLQDNKSLLSGRSMLGATEGEGGLARRAGGHVRTAAEAVEYRRKKREERQAKHGQLSKKQTAEGTNDRLDKLLAITEEAWA